MRSRFAVALIGLLLVTTSSCTEDGGDVTTTTEDLATTTVDETTTTVAVATCEEGVRLAVALVQELAARIDDAAAADLEQPARADSLGDIEEGIAGLRASLESNCARAEYEEMFRTEVALLQARTEAGEAFLHQFRRDNPLG